MEKALSTEDEVEKRILKVFDISLQPSIIFGFFPLSNSQSDLEFSWRSHQTLLVLLRILLSIVCATFYYLSSDIFHSLFWNVSETEHFTEGVIAFICFFGEIVVIVDLIWRRKEIQNFHESLMDLVSATGEAVSNHDLSLLEGHARKLKILVILGFLMTYGATLGREVYILATTEKCVCWYSNLIPLLSLFGSSTLYFRLFTRIWIISIIQVFQLIVKSIRGKIAAFDGTTGMDTCFKETLKIYQKLEKLIIVFNKDFGKFVSIFAVSTLITTLMTSFVSILYFKYVTFDIGTAFTGSAVVFGAMLYAMFASGSDLENEVD